MNKKILILMARGSLMTRSADCNCFIPKADYVGFKVGITKVYEAEQSSEKTYTFDERTGKNSQQWSSYNVEKGELFSVGLERNWKREYYTVSADMMVQIPEYASDLDVPRYGVITDLKVFSPALDLGFIKTDIGAGGQLTYNLNKNFDDYEKLSLLPSISIRFNYELELNYTMKNDFHYISVNYTF